MNTTLSYIAYRETRILKINKLSFINIFQQIVRDIKTCVLNAVANVKPMHTQTFFKKVAHYFFHTSS